jgi:hypothetical protein
MREPSVIDEIAHFLFWFVATGGVCGLGLAAVLLAGW